MYKAILFDLDGTLTESGEGITKCVQYALEKLGRPESDLEKLKVFIGPPLMEQFMKYADMDEAIVIEEKLFGDCFETEDQKYGMAFFLDKNKEKVKEPFKNC